MLAGVVSFGTVLWLSRSRLPAVFLVPFEAVVFIVIAALLYSVISRKPVLTMDETGILYSRGGASRIPWRDILSVERLARVQRSSNGEYHTFIREAWRPIRLQIRGARSDAAEITITFMGLDTDSAVVFDWIRDYMRKSEAKDPNLD